MSVRDDPTAETSDRSRRRARGRAARADVPRSAHATWTAPADRTGPVELLERQARSRVLELVPVRYGRMLVSPFTFFRGAATVMAADLASRPQSGLRTQLCGDAHLLNFGAFAAPDRTLVFDINDFDETLPGPFEWDVKRLVASFAIAGRDRGFTAEQRAVVNTAAVEAYREAMQRFASMSDLDLWYARTPVDALVERFAVTATPKQLKRATRNVAKARAKDNLRAFGKLTETVDGATRIRSDPPVVVATRDLFAPDQRDRLEAAIHGMLRGYARTLDHDRQRLLDRYRYVDSARKVVGVGSVGTRAWIALLLDRADAPLFLQLKEAEASVLEPFAGASGFASHGQRVVEGQRLLQSASDILLGWLRSPDVDGHDRDYYVRQLWDGKGSVRVDLMDETALAAYARACGATLARAHARAGDAVPIAAYLGQGDAFDRALATFAEAYADQNEQDYAEVQAAADAGEIAVRVGV
jgi:uncharacterized protein (DUF2252 family)